MQTTSSHRLLRIATSLYIKELNPIQLQVTYESIYDTKEDIQRIKDYIGITSTKYEHLLDNTNRLRNRGKTKRKLL